MRILGVDPGFANTGWSVVEEKNGRFTVLDYGVIKTKSGDEWQDRIKLIADTLSEVATKYECEACGAEDIFFVKNITSGISVAKVIGAFSYTLISKGLDVCLFTPTAIKNAVVGVGGADKEQIRKMVMLTTGMGEKIKSDHAADSVAAAITYASTKAMRNIIRTR